MQPATTTTSVHKLDPGLWEKNRRTLVRLNVGIVFAPVILAVAADIWIQHGSIWRQDSRGLMTSVLVLLLICTVGWFFAMGRVDRASKRYHSFELSVMPDGLLRRQFDVPELYIPFSQIEKFQTIEGKGAVLGLRSSSQFLWIADELIGYSEVCAIIRQHARNYVESKRLPWWLNPGLLLTACILSTMAVMLSSNLIVVLIATPVLLATLAADWFKLARGVGISKQQKRNLWLLPLIFVAVVLRIVYLLALRPR